MLIYENDLDIAQIYPEITQLLCDNASAIFHSDNASLNPNAALNYVFDLNIKTDELETFFSFNEGFIMLMKIVIDALTAAGLDPAHIITFANVFMNAVTTNSISWFFLVFYTNQDRANYYLHRVNDNGSVTLTYCCIDVSATLNKAVLWNTSTTKRKYCIRQKTFINFDALANWILTTRDSLRLHAQES